MEYCFKVNSYREIMNPLAGVEGEEISETRVFMVICGIDQLPEGIPTETNPRQQNMNTKVAKKIKESLLDNEFNDFFLLNRGIVISAKDLNFDPKIKKLKLKLEDNDVHGIVDGGHSYRCIIDNREDVTGKQFVKLEIITGIESNLERLAGARNTSVQVKDKSLAELENKFNLIKSGISGESFEDNIAYKENENKNIMVDDILAILNMFDIQRYTENSNPVCSYSSKAKCIKNYLEHYEKYGEKLENPFVKMKVIMSDIFELYSLLEKNIGEYYSKSITEGTGKYGRTKGVELSTTKKKFKGMIVEEEIKYKSPKAFLYPILGAFRALVNFNGDEFEFVIEPRVVMDKLGPELVRLTVERSRSLGNNPNAVGKDSNHWAQLFDKVDLYRLKNC